MICHGMGEAPRYCGKRPPWQLIPPSFRGSKSAAGQDLAVAGTYQQLGASLVHGFDMGRHCFRAFFLFDHPPGRFSSLHRPTVAVSPSSETHSAGTRSSFKQRRAGLRVRAPLSCRSRTASRSHHCARAFLAANFSATARHAWPDDSRRNRDWLRRQVLCDPRRSEPDVQPSLMTSIEGGIEHSAVSALPHSSHGCTRRCNPGFRWRMNSAPIAVGVSGTQVVRDFVQTRQTDR